MVTDMVTDMVTETDIIYIWVSLFLFFVTISRHSGTLYMIFDWKDGEKVLDLGEPSFQTKPIWIRMAIFHPVGFRFNPLPKASRMGVEFQKPNIEPLWALLGQAPCCKIGCKIQESVTSPGPSA